MTLPPIVPGPGDPDPTQPVYQQPVPVYYQRPPQAPPSDPARVMGNTVLVVVTLVGLFCVAPVVICLILGAFGAITGNASH